MTEFGKTLRTAREARGLTASQVAETTRMLVSIVEDLENEDFSKIAAPIYGRGFVKLYCEAVGLDPKPLVAEFMELFNGERGIPAEEPPVRKEEPAPVAAPEEKADSAPPEDAAVRQDDLLAPLAPEPPRVQTELRATVLPDRAPVPPARPAPTADGLDADPLAGPGREMSRYGTPFREKRTGTAFSPALLRMTVLLAAAGALAFLLFTAVRGLYRATSAPAAGCDAAADANPETREPKVPEHARAPAPREKVEVPPLYVD